MALRGTLTESDGLSNISLCYESLSSSCVKFLYPTVIRVHLYVFLGTAMVLTVVGNLLVIITVVHFKQLHTPTNILILSLSLADLLVGVIAMPPSIVRSVETCWYFGTLFCKIHGSVDIMCTAASILNLTMISIDRYYAICQPLLYTSKMTIPIALTMAFVCWAVSASYGFIAVFLEFISLGIEDFTSSMTCEGWCGLMFSLPSSALGSSLFFYIPGTLLIIIYLKIFFIAQKQAQSIQSMNQNAHLKQSSCKSEKKATKTLAIVMGLFLLSWAPYVVVVTANAYLGYVTPLLLLDIFGWIGYFNSTFNPVVYAYFYSWFRKAFQIIVSGKVFHQDSSRALLF
ncbi:trace amine-associated receptor 1-like [Sardina pilchardus]|uniref:trace amine-associated receptor 1-like n=1 Tax=Sardina pilchardus TaxID=27697 RepID=UPI002E0D3D11